MSDYVVVNTQRSYESATEDNELFQGCLNEDNDFRRNDAEEEAYIQCMYIALQKMGLSARDVENLKEFLLDWRDAPENSLSCKDNKLMNNECQKIKGMQNCLK